jgi:YVTN family beta-propeller protein
VEFRALGDLQVVEDGQALALGPHQQRAVLALLVLSAGEVVSSDRLIEALWGEHPPASAAKTVQVYISRLRKTLNGAPASSSGGLIVTVDHGYVLRVDPGQVDVRAFEGLLDRGREAFADREFDAAATVLRQALGLWRGAPLADFTFDAFAAGDIARLQELRLEALEIRIDAELALGRHSALVAELEALTTEHPLRERLRAARMLALYRCGREPEALALYRETRRLLVDELGMEPSPALRELHDAILRQDPALEAPPAPQPPGDAGGDGRGRRRRRAAVVAAALALAGGVAAVIGLLAPGATAPVHVAANAVAVIDPARNAVVHQIAVGARPADISAGAGGVWVDNLDDNSISEIDPKSATVKRTLSIDGASIDALAAGRDTVWTIDYARATATKIDPVSGVPVGRVTFGPAPFSSIGVGGSSPVAVAGDGVWASTGNPPVVRIDARSRRVDAKVAVGNEPTAIASAAGAVWVADDVDNTVTRVDAGGVVAGPLPVGHGASGIAVGDGSVWVANTLDDTVTRIDAATGATKDIIPVGAGPRGIAVSPGAVWVANSRGASVSRIDPRTDHVRTIPVGASPEGVAVAAGRVWVSVQAAAPPPGKPLPGGTLRIVQPHDFNSTDPATLFSFDNSAGQLAYATCAKLLDYPDRAAPQGTRLVPEVAAAMPTVSRDRRTYTFTVRPGFRFSPPSNQPVSALAFRREIERYLREAGTTDIADIVGAGDYAARRTARVAGLSATASTLAIRLVHPSPSLPARIAMLGFCAVPPDTPIASGGIKQQIPSAGPYYIVSHTPESELVLRRNPNYHGPRPARLDTIDYRFGVTPAQAAALVEAGHADYADSTLGQFRDAGAVSPAVDARLERDYGPHSPSARAGRQRYFVNRTLQTSYLTLNAHRPLFASARMRRAVNFAIDRAALARDAAAGYSSQPTDQFLPPAMPGFRDADIYPLGGPDVTRARRLARGHARHAVMYTCTTPACRNVGETVRANLGAIGISVAIKQFPLPQVFDRQLAPGARYDIGLFGWLADYSDPSQYIDTSTPGLALNFAGAGARRYRQRIAAAAELSGARRLRAYGQLDIDLATHVAPVAAYANSTPRDFFAARIGCQTYQPIYGIDLATLCIRHG